MSANETKHTGQESSDGEVDSKRRFRWLGVKRGGLTLGITALIAGTVVAHGLLLATHRWGATPASAQSQEATLGQFHYVARGPGEVGIRGATFQLSVALLDDIAPLARRRLASHQRKVQQSVEELLRRVHPGDFDDPALVGLKRHLQTQINDALGIRAISEVLITDLVLEPRGPLPSAVAPADLAAGQSAGANAAP